MEDGNIKELICGSTRANCVGLNAEEFSLDINMNHTCLQVTTLLYAQVICFSKNLPFYSVAMGCKESATFSRLFSYLNI